MSEFFSENFPLISSPEELEVVKAQFPQYEDAYIATACIKDRREWVNRLWEMYEPYADDNFLTELKTHGRFNERTWEMHVGSVFLKHGLRLHKKSVEGPDLHALVNNQSVWVEATAPGVGEVDPAPERPDLAPGEMYSSGGDIEEIERPKILRITAAVNNKKPEYKKNLDKGIIKEKDPFVIAINGHAFGGIISDVDYLVRRSFFSAGCVAYSKQPDGSWGPPIFLYKPTVEKRTPEGLIQIPTDLFTNESNKEISAVLFCADHIVPQTDDWGSLGENFMLVRNPFARNPLPEDFPLFGRECALNGQKISYRS